jgi:hypothetical protein
LLRGHKALIDADLAALYGVSTKRLNEQVKRNRLRFPADFVFQLTAGERDEVAVLAHPAVRVHRAWRAQGFRAP